MQPPVAPWQVSLATAAALWLLASGCGYAVRQIGESSSVQQRTQGSSALIEPKISDAPALRALIGLPVNEAEHKVKAMGLPLRVVEAAHPTISLERMPDRVNLLVKDGTVSKVWQG
jgi:hypothetical protein